MATESKDTWDKLAIVTAVIGSLFLPIIVFVVGKMYEQAEVARLTQQREAEAAERNADRVAALLTHLASENPQERLLATRFVDYLVRNNLFPKELLDQQVFIDLVEDKDEAVAHAAAHVLTEAVRSNPTLRQAVEKAAQSNEGTRRAVLKAADRSPELKRAIDITKIERTRIE